MPNMHREAEVGCQSLLTIKAAIMRAREGIRFSPPILLFIGDAARQMSETNVLVISLR